MGTRGTGLGLPVVRRATLPGRLLRRPSALVGLLLLGLVLAMAALAGTLFPQDPFDMAGPPLLAPGESPAFLLGTDMMGRDIAAGLFHGARVSLLIGGVATLVSLLIGIGVGALAGYYGGVLDTALMRLTELFQTIPPFLFALAMVAILQPTVATITFAIGITSWSALARLVRAEVLRLRGGELAQASIVLGASDRRIIFLHILPNALAPIIVSASVLVATAILTESSLSFLGLGDPNVVSWGSMIGEGRDVIRTDPHVVAIPGLAILVSVLALNLLGDGLNDALGGRERRS